LPPWGYNFGNEEVVRGRSLQLRICRYYYVAALNTRGDSLQLVEDALDIILWHINFLYFHMFYGDNH